MTINVSSSPWQGLPTGSSSSVALNYRCSEAFSGTVVGIMFNCGRTLSYLRLNSAQLSWPISGCEMHDCPEPLKRNKLFTLIKLVVLCGVLSWVLMGNHWAGDDGWGAQALVVRGIEALGILLAGWLLVTGRTSAWALWAIIVGVLAYGILDSAPCYEYVPTASPYGVMPDEIKVPCPESAPLRFFQP